MDFSTHSWHRPKDPSPNCTERMAAESKRTKDEGMVQEGGFSVRVCKACVLLLVGVVREADLV